MPGKNAAAVGPVSYEEPVKIEPATKISDPLSLKLRYAKWMEEVENFPEAQANYNIVLQERPADIEAVLGLARIDQLAGRGEAAEAGFKKALGLKPESAVAMNALGQYYVSQQRFAEALPLLNQAMAADPDNKMYRFHVGIAMARSGDVSAAMPHLVESVGEATAHFNMGMICKSQGKFPQAEQHLLQAIAGQPDFEEAIQEVTQLRQLMHATQTYASQPAQRQPVQPQLRPQPQLQPRVQQVGYQQPAVPQQPTMQQVPVVQQPAVQQLPVVQPQGRQPVIQPQVQPPVIRPQGQQPVLQPQRQYPAVQQPSQQPPATSLTPAQQEQLRNQRALIR